MAEVVIPAKLAATVVDWEGDSGRDWLAGLPALIDEVAEASDLDLRDPFDPGGNISWVAPARRRSDGVEPVLKLQHPHPESAREPIVLAAWDGAGAVRPLAHDGPRLVWQPDPLRADDPAALVAVGLEIVAEGLVVDQPRLVEWCLVGAIEMAASSAALGDKDAAARSRAHADLIVPHLP